MKKRAAPTLQCLDIGKAYWSGTSRTSVLENFSLELNPGEIGMLMGPSGCGKTTLLMTAGGILIPDTGEYPSFWPPSLWISLKVPLSSSVHLEEHPIYKTMIKQ